MIISEILKCPVDYKFGGVFTIKTAKKKWEVEGEWVQQAVLTDKTGDILVDVNIVKNIPLQRSQQIRVIVGQIQESRVYVDQFKLITQIGEPEPFFADDSANIIRGKIACLIVAQYAVTNTPEAIEAYSGSQDLKDTVKNIINM